MKAGAPQPGRLSQPGCNEPCKPPTLWSQTDWKPHLSSPYAKPPPRDSLLTPCRSPGGGHQGGSGVGRDGEHMKREQMTHNLETSRGRKGCTTCCLRDDGAELLLIGLCSDAQCLSLCDPLDCPPPGFSVHGVLQARILEWIAISSSRGSSQPRGQTCVTCVSYTERRILYHRVT